VTDRLYRPARPATVWWNVTKTLFEFLALWFIFLIALPIGIAVIEVQLAMQRFPGYPVVASILLGLFALLGLWAALTLAVAGRGTPLPVDEARRLVVTGPYAYVRNPMAISALGQGTALVLALGSYPVMAYVLAAGLWVYYYSRPREERHLKKRYGDRWMEYQREVRAFRPRLRPYTEEKQT
jgi:protein-S-isoprenylcysteine O-methyltransferase Ste14